MGGKKKYIRFFHGALQLSRLFLRSGVLLCSLALGDLTVACLLFI